MRRPLRIALAAVTAFMLFSCDTLKGFPPLGSSGPAPRGMVPLYGNLQTGTGTLLVRLTDAPAEYDKVLVTISEVAIHRAGEVAVASPAAAPSAEPSAEPTPEASPSPEGGLTTLANKGKGKPAESETQDQVAGSVAPAEAERDAGWIKLAVTMPMPVDLLTLKDSVADLGLAELSAGKYTQIRLQVTSAQVLLKDGTTQDLKIPSGTIKLVHPFTIGAGAQTQLTLDFDAAKSVHQTGNGQFQMKPTIQVVATTVPATPSESPSAAPSAEPTADPTPVPSAEATPTPEASPSDPALEPAA